MNPSRATLATTGLLLFLLAACTEQTVVPTEPSRVAPMTSIPGSSSVNVRTGQEADRFVEATAEAWSRNGDARLSQDLMEQRGLTVLPGSGIRSRSGVLSPSRPNLVVSTGGGTPSPSSTPNAIIYYSSTSVYVNGSSGLIVSSVTYFGNIANNEVSYSATDASGGVVIPVSTVKDRGLGQYANCIGSAWECSWTFRFQTTISLALGRDCGVTLKANATHSAQWTTPSVRGLPVATWGTDYSADGVASASNGPCAPPQTNTGGGDASAPPSTGGTTQPPTYQPGPFVPSGHWECYLTYVGTDYETEKCTWYGDYAKLPTTSPAFALIAGDGASHTLNAAELPTVFVIVSDQIPVGAMAVIERHKQGPYKNVLLVPSSTIRPAVLVAALRALADSRDSQGETPTKDLQLILQGGILDQQIPAAARDYAASFTALIANAKRGDAGAYGVRPILEIRLGERK